MIRIGTRGSQLALWQANFAKDYLKRLSPQLEIEIRTIQTSGDINQTIPIDEIGGKTVFVKEIEDALQQKKIDLAVHSLKDLSVCSPDGLENVSYMGGFKRTDALVLKEGQGLSALKKGAKVGTSSIRRRHQLSDIRDDIEFPDLRGNIDTRIKKLADGEYDAIVLASAGLERLGLLNHISYEFSPHELIPAGGQGILALQGRANDTTLDFIRNDSQDESSRLSAEIEFSYLKEIGAGCLAPVGIYSTIHDQTIELITFIADVSSGKSLRFERSYSKEKVDSMGLEFANEIKSQWKELMGEELKLSD